MADSSSLTDQTPKEKPIVITSSSAKKPIFKFSLVNPKILAGLTVLLLLIGGVGAGVYLTQTPPQTTTEATLSKVDLSFKPDKLESPASSSFSVDIFANANQNQITGIDLKINYDPKILTLESITPGEFLSQVLVPPKIESGAASISLGTDGTAGVTGSGIIASLSFKTASASGQALISFDPVLTKIKVLNRVDGSSDTLGQSRITVTPAQSVPSSSPSASLAPSQTPSPSPSLPGASAQPKENTDLNGDGIINTLDRIMFMQQSSPQP